MVDGSGPAGAGQRGAAARWGATTWSHSGACSSRNQPKCPSRAADAAVKLAADLVARPPDSRGAKPVVACAPAPHSAVPTIGPGGAPAGDELAAIVRDEIVRALRG